VYALGQMQNAYAASFLTSVLEDESEHSITRHEAAEALGALGAPEHLKVLQRFSSYTNAPPEVAETCSLAVDRIAHKISKGACACDKNVSIAYQNAVARGEAKQLEPTAEDRSGIYVSVDPAPALEVTGLSELRALLLDESASLFERYRAMFALRDQGTAAAALTLCDGFQAQSALFKHEIAFVLGQLEDPCTVDALSKVRSCAPKTQLECRFGRSGAVQMLNDRSQHPMVRHEAAEALGAIGSSSVLELLTEMLHDEEEIVICQHARTHAQAHTRVRELISFLCFVLCKRAAHSAAGA
jgi:deoxyhypusine monooxygenase